MTAVSDEVTELVSRLDAPKAGAGCATDVATAIVRVARAVAREEVDAIRPRAEDPGALDAFQAFVLLQRLRAHGWMVAVHNDYRQEGKVFTFWLFTKGGSALKGEGPSDLAALKAVVGQLGPGELR